MMNDMTYDGTLLSNTCEFSKVNTFSLQEKSSFAKMRCTFMGKTSQETPYLFGIVQFDFNTFLKVNKDKLA